MLILTRKVGESIMIGDDIRLIVTATKGNSIRLGVDAPRSVQVLRLGAKNQAPEPNDNSEDGATCRPGAGTVCMAEEESADRSGRGEGTDEILSPAEAAQQGTPLEIRDPAAVEVIDLVRLRFGTIPTTASGVSPLELDAAERVLQVVLPPTYRTYLEYFGSIAPTCHDLLGLPRGPLCGDLVLMNQIGPHDCAPTLVQFTTIAVGQPLYLNTAQKDNCGECPVVSWDRVEGERTIAASFLEYLSCSGAASATRSLART